MENTKETVQETQEPADLANPKTAANTTAIKKKKNIRDNLLDFVSRFYELSKYKVKRGSEGRYIEIFEPKSKFSVFSYAFDRRSKSNHPSAELVSFNSEKLNDILKNVTERGHLAKGFVPFDVDPASNFETAFSNLIKKGKDKSRGFLLNGTARGTKPSIGYLPFLLLLLKIQLESIETREFVEKLIVPVTNLQDQSGVVKIFAEKIWEYFDDPDPEIAVNMPVKGNIEDFNDENVRAALKIAMETIRDSIQNRREAMKGRMDNRLSKELQVLERYYENRIDELETRIIRDKEKLTDPNRTRDYIQKKKEDIEKSKKELERIKKEYEVKQGEYRGIYDVEVDFELMGMAAIYFPANFYYFLELETEYRKSEKKIFYDIFAKALIPPKCACGAEIYQGYLCSHDHLACPECTFHCKECNITICKSCDMHTCRVCGQALCAEHTLECESCKAQGRTNFVICREHLLECHTCGIQICESCGTTCNICGKVVCTDSKRDCSTKCSVCKEFVCTEHITRCPICNKKICPDCLTECSHCHQLVGEPHLAMGVCTTCQRATPEKFYTYYRKNLDTFQPPPQFGITDLGPVSTPSRTNSRSRATPIPKNYQKITLGENRQFMIFTYKKVTETFVWVFNTETEEELLYRTPSILGKIRNFLIREKPPERVVLRKSKAQASREQGQRTCPNCQKEFPSDFQVCPFCATKLEVIKGK